MNGIREPHRHPVELTGTTVDKILIDLIGLAIEPREEDANVQVVKHGRLAPTFHSSRYFILCDLFEKTDVSKKSS